QAIGWDETRWAEAMADYFDEYEDIGIGAEARSAAMVRIENDPETGTWHATQILDDPEGDRDWRIEATIDLPATDETGHVMLADLSAGPAARVPTERSEEHTSELQSRFDL